MALKIKGICAPNGVPPPVFSVHVLEVSPHSGLDLFGIQAYGLRTRSYP